MEKFQGPDLASDLKHAFGKNANGLKQNITNILWIGHDNQNGNIDFVS